MPGCSCNITGQITADVVAFKICHSPGNKLMVSTGKPESDSVVREDSLKLDLLSVLRYMVLMG